MSRPLEAFTIETGDWTAHYVRQVVPPPTPGAWAFPVGNAKYPPEVWYAASFHSPHGELGYWHAGIDLNLDIAPRGDIERQLGLAIYAVADGTVTYVTESWSGVPMIVVQHEHAGAPLWVRYAHIVPVVQVGEVVTAGQKLGAFADWKTGDHLHFDCAQVPYTTEYLSSGIAFLDPVPVLKAHLDAALVDALLAQG